MKKSFVIMNKELKSYFLSPIAYLVLTFFLLISGFVFYIVLAEAVKNLTLNPYFNEPINVPSLIISTFGGFVGTLFLFLGPLITMGVYADERKKKTLELLLTSPIRDGELILGKYFSGLIFILILLLASYLNILILFYVSKPDLLPTLGAFLGLILFAASLVSLGNFVSSLTENQIVAAIITFILFLILWFFDIFTRESTTGWRGVLGYLSPLKHLQTLQRGVINLYDIVYFLSFISFFLFLTYRSIESLKWRS